MPKRKSAPANVSASDYHAMVDAVGVTPAKLIGEDDDDSPPVGGCGSNAHLQSGKLGAQILREEGNAGNEEHWALIRFPIIVGKKRTIDVGTDVSCSETTDQMDVTTETIEYLSQKWKDKT